MASKYSSEEPELYLPLQKLDKCSFCKAQGVKLSACASCAEVIYCSPECQKKDWKSHKVLCGQTDRIDFQSYYPFVAAVQHICHIHPDAAQHPALTHKIVNSPNPGSAENIVGFPDGTSAMLVLLGDKISSEQVSTPRWWPTAQSDMVRSKLMRRIVAEGLLLPIVYATTLALIGEIYTTTAAPATEHPYWQVSGRRRVRLQYNKSPIADIGIAKGTCTRVTSQDRLAYYNIKTNEFLMGQDPTDHYWIYFTTLHGHEYFLDCGMFTFNFSMMTDISEYTRYGFPPRKYAPAFFYGREEEKRMPLTGRFGWKPDEKFSILRNSDLRGILRTRDYNYCDCHDVLPFNSLMDEIAGRTCTPWEKDMAMMFFDNARRLFRLNVQNREYLNFPKEPKICFDMDPGETLKPSSEEEAKEDDVFPKYLRKWTRKLKQGKITPSEWDAAFNAWHDKPNDVRMKMAGGGGVKQKRQTHKCEPPPNKEERKKTDAERVQEHMMERLKKLGIEGTVSGPSQ